MAVLTPSYLADVAEPMVELWSKVECDIIADIAKRLTKADFMTETAKWQAFKVREMGATHDEIVSILAKSTKLSKKQISQIVGQACADALEVDVKQYHKAGLDTSVLKSSDALRSVIRAGERKTNGLFTNFTRTTARTAERAFENCMDMVWMQVQSGAFSLDYALRKAINELGEKGMTSIAYPSGHVDKLDVAARRAAVTGINQAACEMQLEAAAMMGCDLVEVTSHAGARPSHEVWQGQIYSLSGKSKKYRPFKQATGYGTGDGLGGWNCRHNFFPYLQGASTPTFDKDPNRLLGKSNAQVYAESQRQRELERRVRASRRACTALDAAINSEADDKLRAQLKEDFDSASLLLKRREEALKDYCHDTGRTLERDRMTVFGYNRSVGGKVRAVNQAFDRYSAAIPKATPSHFLAYRTILEQKLYKGTVVPIEKHKALILADLASKSDPDHIMKRMRERHITDDEVQSYVDNAVMCMRQYRGTRLVYFSHDGITVLAQTSDYGEHDWIAKTAFKRCDYTDEVLQVLEVAAKYGTK